MTETIAVYEDGTGKYTILRDGDTLTTQITNEGVVIESYSAKLIRAPQYDPILEADVVLTERFASTPDLGPDGVVWIDGKAYETEWLYGEDIQPKGALA